MQPKIEGPFIVSADKLVKYGSENAYPNVPQFPAIGNGKCPILPQTLLPAVRNVSNFIQVSVLYKGSEADRRAPPNGYGYERYAEIKRGTIIFTPNALGRYDNYDTGNHVAIFLSYGVRDGKNGIFVVDQYPNRTNGRATAGIRFIKAGTGSMPANLSNDARAFAVVLAIRP